ncbi:hypothetical protein QBC38DRAFT_465085 [Podospora fimiseda]|uniref:Uncharacterized protein n=1 Tax=Podospora fimiseda TaxID=252190 RepID=A0AAN7BYK1_9PEZI|nr:hypothetical protein QBC38DRAFT_465085 [Podospora fimiseda]
MAQPTPPPPSLGSNNPFRRKTVATSSTAASGSGSVSSAQLPPPPPPPTSFQKPKVVKRVRVQSPPPSSPESAGGMQRVRKDESESDDDSESDSDSDSVDKNEVVIPISTFGTPPPNPFQSTARNLQSSGTPGSGGTKGGLDVSAFERLLLTGQTGGTTPAAQHIAHQMVMGGADVATASNTAGDATSISQDHTPWMSHEISEREVEDEKLGLITPTSPALQPAPTILRKKPPPPSSRHGKLIRPEASKPSQPTNRTTLTLPTPRDINKPLPFSPEVEETTNIFDHSAAGKVPEPRPPTPPQPSKRPAPPAPAPRRQPHRQQSSLSSGTAATPKPDDHDSFTRRSSMDSVRSRSSSLRVSVSHAVPPPAPPPRRPAAGHGRGLSNSISSPPPPSLTSPGGSDSLSALETPLSGLGIISGGVVGTPPQLSGSGTPDGGIVGSGSSSVNMYHLHSKLSPPPPPPARNLSVRAGKRPMSTSERKGSGTGSGTGLKSPPPPVPKHREEVGRATSVGSFKSSGGEEVVVNVQGQSVDILADLTRLQMEVDALRAGLVNNQEGGMGQGKGVEVCEEDEM